MGLVTILFLLSYKSSAMSIHPGLLNEAINSRANRHHFYVTKDIKNTRPSKALHSSQYLPNYFQTFIFVLFVFHFKKSSFSERISNKSSLRGPTKFVSQNIHINI